MTKITRATQTIFALSATNTGVFGSAADGTKIHSTNVETLQEKTAWNSGWASAVIGTKNFPALEEFQALDYITTYQIAYIFQEGVPEYDDGTTYYTNSIVKKPGTYQLYGSLTNINLNNALTDATNWRFLTDLSVTPISVAYGITTNSGNIYSVTTTPAVASPTAGQIFGFEFNATNTGNVTLGIGSASPVPVLDQDGNQIPAGFIVPGRNYPALYSGTNIYLGTQIQNGSSYGVTTNTSNAYAVTLVPLYAKLLKGQSLFVNFNAANTDSITLAVNGGSAITVHDASGNNIPKGAIVAGTTYPMTFDGTNLILFNSNEVKRINRVAVASSGTYNATAGTIMIDVEVLGAGGGAGFGTTGSSDLSSGGGAAGTWARGRFFPSDFGSGVSCSIGAAGTGGASSGSAGTDGGATAFGTLLSCPGGHGSIANPGTIPGGMYSSGGLSGGMPTGTYDAAKPGDHGYNAYVNNYNNGTDYNGYISGRGASSNYGVGGKEVGEGGAGAAIPGNAAAGFGSGGGGAVGAQAGGAGAAGWILVTEYINN